MRRRRLWFWVSVSYLSVCNVVLLKLIFNTFAGVERTAHIVADYQSIKPTAEGSYEAFIPLWFDPFSVKAPSVNLKKCMPSSSSTVTTFIHQSWKTSNPVAIYNKFAATWKACFPSWRYILWTDHDNRRLVKIYFPSFLARFDALPSNLVRAEAARYMYMFIYGGIYADLDTECVRPFHHLLRNHSVVLGARKQTSILPEGYTQNSFMYSAPGHPLWMAILNQIFGDQNQRALATVSGSYTLMFNVLNHRSKCSQDIKIYFPHYFNPIDWHTDKTCPPLLTMTEDKFINCRRKYLFAYVIHYNALA